MWKLPQLRWKSEYAPLPTNLYTPTSRGGSSIRAISIAIAASLLTFFLGYETGHSRGSPTGCQPNVELSSVSEVFLYNRTFGEPPSDRTNAAWASLFPKQGGFFKHPTIAPHRSAFAVFHQLHCLDGIRQGYWAMHAAATAGGEPFDDKTLPLMISPPHIRHCIDLLRHVLMCRPDTTVEVRDEEIKGVTGFGTEHQCSNFDELLKWTSVWETWGQEKNATRKGGVEHGHNHGVQSHEHGG